MSTNPYDNEFSPSTPVALDPELIRMLELEDRVTNLSISLSSYNETVLKPIREIMAQLDEQRAALIAAVQQVDKENRVQKDALTQAASEEYQTKYELEKAQRELESLRLLRMKRLAFEKTNERVQGMLEDAPFYSLLFPYQREDIAYLVNAFEAGKSGVLNANEMGLGKTLESIALDFLLWKLFEDSIDPKTGREFGRKPQVLWLTNKSLVKQTVAEFRKFSPTRKVFPVVGTFQKSQREMITSMARTSNAVVVANYETATTTDEIKNNSWDIVFFDEVARLKGGANPNGPTKIWEAAQALVQKATFQVPMSGTPIQNHPRDMWAYLHLFDPVKFPSARRFESEYCYGWPELKVDFNRLIKAMSDRVIRHTKKEVLKDLPEKLYSLRDIDMTPNQRKIYNDMRNNFFVWLDSNKDSHVGAPVIIAWITRLRQIALWPQSIQMFDEEMKETRTIDCPESGIIDETIDIIEELLQSGEKVVVWSAQFNAPLYEVARRVKELGAKAGVICAATEKLHEDYITSFQDPNGDVKVLCINMKVGGTGLNLQVSSHAIFMDLFWNPATNRQAEDRNHRIGQKNNVTYHILNATDSVYQFVQEKIAQKEEMSDQIMEDKALRKGSSWKDYLGGLI